MGPRTVIGTTDTRVRRRRPKSPMKTITVLSNINKRLNLDRPLTPQDVIAESAVSGPSWLRMMAKKHREIGRSCRENM